MAVIAPKDVLLPFCPTVVFDGPVTEIFPTPPAPTVTV
jgi:hypothetical protein